MYASLQYTASTTVAQVMADVIAVMTGAQGMLLSALPSPKNTAGSFLTSEIAGGWTVHDAAPYYVLKAPISDDATKFKYIKFNTTATSITFESYKSWNEVAHTGVMNRRMNAENTSVGFNYVYHSEAGTSSLMLLSVSSNHVAGAVMYSNSTKVIGLSLLSEHTRTSPWDTIANGYPPIVYTNLAISSNNGWDSILAQPSSFSHSWFIKPLWPATSSTDYDASVSNLTNAQNCTMSVITQNGMASMYSPHAGAPSTAYLTTIFMPAASVLDENKQPSRPIMSMGFTPRAYATAGCAGGSISDKCGVYLGSQNSGVTNSVIVKGGNRYRVWVINDSTGAPASGYRPFIVLEK